MDRISLVCFGASYAVALALEAINLLRPKLWLRLGSLTFGAAGLLAHSLFLVYHFSRPDAQRPLATQSGSMLFLAWIVAIFYLYGSFHYRRIVWGVFVLPIVLGLVGLAWLVTAPDDGAQAAELAGLTLHGETLWRTIHGILLLLAAVGVSVGFVASLMYLVQQRRLRAKVVPGPGQRMFSLERLEAMNRRAINWSFLLLTAGVLIGTALLIQGRNQLQDWTDPRVLGGFALLVIYGLVFYLRYGVHLAGRRLAQLTIVVFALLLFTLASAHHPFVPRGSP